MPTLSVVVITKNEAKTIAACLESVAWADEIIVLDSGSEDGTPQICRDYSPKVKVWETDWPGYGIQKQRALEKATGDWVLSLDADERVMPELGVAIQALLKLPLKEIVPTEPVAFKIRFYTEYCGYLLRFGVCNPEYRSVLFRRGYANFSSLQVHEGVKVQGKIAALPGYILHRSFANLESVITKMNTYSTLSAAQKKAAGKKGGLGVAMGHGLFSFIRGYILKLGFLDGKAGFMFAFSNAEGSYYRYLKMMNNDSP